MRSWPCSSSLLLMIFEIRREHVANLVGGRLRGAVVDRLEQHGIDHGGRQ